MIAGMVNKNKLSKIDSFFEKQTSIGALGNRHHKDQTQTEAEKL